MQKPHHVLEAQQFDKDWLEYEFFPLVKAMEKIPREKAKMILRDREMISFFYEPSTRTRFFSELAMQRLGGQIVFSTENAKNFSSIAKGESIEDTIRILCLGKPDVIVLRTDEEGMAKKAAKFSTVPIINAGDGKGQHPTQALTDLYTIQKEIGRIAETWIAMCGDLNRGRTARSLAYLYAKFHGVKISFVSPDAARMRQDVKDYLTQQNVWFEEIYDLRKIAGKVDGIYSTRIQRDRGGDILFSYGPQSFWKVNQEILDLMRQDAIIMHPLPHLEEISLEVDKDARAVYFSQAANKLYIMMALLKMILK